MTAATFDLLAHQRGRTRDAEGRAAMLEVENARLRTLLMLALLVASARTNVDPMRLLRFLDVAASAKQEKEDELRRLAKLLRETAPERLTRRLAAA